ncbi:hypothetical protein RRG08_012417 [Elysia crispata]|uniref:Uncharacterized protein n=1 Tax=Elysia crispata TaxID=231223 RepID=A0AAE1AEK6_9GAST|nr:hypothetical protein RRG08_012417 [Elysia crispata]
MASLNDTLEKSQCHNRAKYIQKYNTKETMEGYVFALMANSGTDPDLEEEDALKELREKELELRYLVNMEDTDERATVSRMLEEADAKLMSHPAVLDHYRACWPSDVPTPTLQDFSPGISSQSIAESLEDTKRPAGLQRKVGAGRDRQVKPSKQLTWIYEPAPFQVYTTPGSYKSLPPLQVAMPRFSRTCLRPAARRQLTSQKCSPLLQQQDKGTMHSKALCCKPPRNALNGLFFQSYWVLKRHYESLSYFCQDNNKPNGNEL